MKVETKKDVLIALMNNQRDFEIAREHHWYRIPVKSAPENVRNGVVRHLAFYHTKVFKEDAFSVRWCSRIRRISVVKRKELFPGSPSDPKAENEYYKIEFYQLQPLPAPIISRRLRRVLFISTTWTRFQHAKEINDVFHESPIEEEFWEALRVEGISAERQFMVGTESRFFYLDFALFCKDRNIDIECDGDAFHTKIDDVKRDKKRNNTLESLGWSVLRFTTDDIRQNLKESIRQTKKTINRYGGLQDITTPAVFRRFSDGEDKQLNLFGN